MYIKDNYPQTVMFNKSGSKDGSKAIAAEPDFILGDSVNISGKEESSAPPKKWTIMHYSAGDNNLKEHMEWNINEMELVGSTDNMNVVVQFDKGDSDCKIYKLEKDSDMEKINSPILKDMGSTNMCDPKILTDFIKFSMEKFPAENYALIISDHGYGWIGAIDDYSHDDLMTVPRIGKALDDAAAQTGRKLDLVGFDACRMATTEVAFEIKDSVNYMVASEENEGSRGWPYVPLFSKSTIKTLDNALSTRLNISPEDFAKKIVSDSEAVHEDLPTMSAIDLSKMPELKKATDSFGDAVLKTETPGIIFKEIAKETQQFGSSRDQFHFAENIVESGKIIDQNLKEAAFELMDAIETAVIAEEHSPAYPNAHGLTVEVPPIGGVGIGYTDLKYAKETLWDEAMNKTKI